MMAAVSFLPVVPVATASSTLLSPSSSTILHHCNKISNLSIENRTTHHYSSNPNLKSLNFRAQFPRFPLLCPYIPNPACAAFDAYETEGESEALEIPEPDDQGEYDEGEEKQQQKQPEQNISKPSDACRLFVGNLPYTMTSSHLTDIFGEAGRVVSAEIIYDRVTDRSRGFAFVSMGSVEEAREAIRLYDGSQVGGRNVKVNIPEVPRGGERELTAPKIRTTFHGFVDTPHKIYAGNLNWNLTSQGLKEAFGHFPGFLSAKVIYERNSGRSRGFGFVSFASAEEVESAFDTMNGVEIQGRPLRLNLATERPSPASPPATELKMENCVDSGQLLASISA